MMNSIMISCRKATELIEKKSTAELSFPEKIKLRMHTAMCRACTNYQRQSIFIDNMLKHFSTNLTRRSSAEQNKQINGLIEKILGKK